MSKAIEKALLITTPVRRMLRFKSINTKLINKKLNLLDKTIHHRNENKR